MPCIASVGTIGAPRIGPDNSAPSLSIGLAALTLACRPSLALSVSFCLTERSGIIFVVVVVVDSVATSWLRQRRRFSNTMDSRKLIWLFHSGSLRGCNNNKCSGSSSSFLNSWLSFQETSVELWDMWVAMCGNVWQSVAMCGNFNQLTGRLGQS